MISGAIKGGPGGIDTPPLAPVFINGKPINALISAIDDQAGNSGSPKPSNEARFWASHQRPGLSPTIDVFQISISSVRTINTLQFSLARFPQTATVQYLDSETSNWLPVIDRHGFPVSVRITESVPARIAPQILQQGAPHPQHYGAGHWVRQDIDIHPVNTAQFRVLLKRSPGDYPRDTFGSLVDYSLGVKDFNLGFRITGLDDIPHRPVDDDHIGERAPFLQGLDALGSPIEISLRENRAYDLLRGRPWRSAPQPVANAIVNLYIDARDAYGEGQVIDRFFVDPITTGVHCNLYYSNDSAAPFTFKSGDAPLISPTTLPIGTVVPTPEGILFNPNDPGVLSINNSGVQWNTNQPWTIGIEFIPNFASDDPSTYTLLDTGALKIQYSAGHFTATFGGLLFANVQADFTAGNPTTVVVQYDANGDLHLVTPTTTNIAPGSADSFYPPSPVLYLGADFDTTAQFDGTIRTFTLKSLTVGDETAQFIADPRATAVLPEYRYLDQGQSDNALIRIHPDNQSAGLDSPNPFGVEGGPANVMETLRWTPVNRSFTLHRGFMQFDPIKAKRFKMEFTALAPEPFETSVPVVTTIRTYPKKIRTVGLLSHLSESSTQTGTIGVHADVAGVSNEYADAARITFLNRDNIKQAFTSTEALKASDPKLAERLAEASLYFNLTDWQKHASILRWPGTTVHDYEQVEIEHTKRIAFFVALSALEMYRVNYQAEDDTKMYLELFHDDAFIEDSNFSRGENQIYTGATIFDSQATSRVFSSRRRVRGIQFATQQSPPAQLLSDPDFREDSLPKWAAYGTAKIEDQSSFDSDVGSSVKVKRTTRNATWGEVEAAYGSTVTRSFAVALVNSGDLVTATGHGLAIDDTVVFSAKTGGAGITVGTTYYIITAGFTADAFQVSTASGGSAVVITSDGTATATNTDNRTWQDIQDTDQTWYSMEHEGVTGIPEGGVVGTQVVGTSRRGRLYGAARVFVDETLQEPLYLQIVSEAGDVLAESSNTPVAGQVSEWTVEYTIGEGGAVTGRTWADVQGVSQAFNVTFTDTGDLVGAVGHGLVAGNQVVFDHILDTTGLTEGTTYYVIASGLTADAFKVSATFGGSAVALTTDGTGEAVALLPNTWQDLEDFGTWQDVSEESALLQTNVYPRLIQKTETEEEWSVYNISLFDDVIVWEFSNNGGANWYPAYDIRNDPDGAMLFPDFDDTSIDPIRGKQLQWRVSAYAPNVRVSSLAIRPLYSEHVQGMPYRDNFQGSGPNVSTQDDYADVHEDPRWAMWSKPVPESWYYEFRRWLLLDDSSTTSITPPPANEHPTDGEDPNPPTPDGPDTTPETDFEYPLYVFTLSNDDDETEGPSLTYTLPDVEGLID